MKMNNKSGAAMLFIAILLLSMAFIPAVSASSGKGATSASVGKDIGILTTYSIVQGQTRNHYTTINNPGWHTFKMVLNWIPSSDSLKLTVYSPAGTPYGPWYDSSDGKMDGQISTKIWAPNGLPTGTWTSRVYGQSVAGTAHYTYNVYIS